MSQEYEVSRLRYHLEKWWSNDLNDEELRCLRSHFWDRTDALLKYYSNN